MTARIIVVKNCMLCGRLIREGVICRKHLPMFNRWKIKVAAELAELAAKNPSDPSIA